MGDKSSAFERAVAALLEYLTEQRYSFVTVTPATHARVIARFRNKPAETLREAFGWNAPFAADLLPTDLMSGLRQAEVITPSGAMWCSNVRVSSLGGHLFVHSSYPTSEADAVFFGPDTYRFTSAVLRRIQSVEGITRVADVGCGTGAAGILIGRNRLEAEIFLGDINPRALEYAAINAAAARVDNVSICQSNILAQLPGAFDLIVANPPYLVDPSQRSYRHGGRAMGTELGLRILQASLERLAPNGTGLIYTGAPFIVQTGVISPGSQKSRSHTLPSGHHLQIRFFP